MKSALTGVVLAMMLTACGGSDSLSAAEVEDIKDDAFVKVVRDRLGSGVEYLTDEAIVKAGHITCEQFDGGATMLSMEIALSDVLKITFEQAAGFIGGSIAAYCPEHMDVIS